MIEVNWDDTKAYVAWLSRKTGKSYRLLSEAEREYVSRGGTTTPFWWGSSITPKQANYDGSVDPYKGGGSRASIGGALCPSTASSPTPGASTMSTAMCGSGRRTAGTTATLAIPAMAGRERQAIVAGGQCAAVPGSTILRVSAPPVASGGMSSIATSSSASAWPERWILDLVLSCSFASDSVNYLPGSGDPTAPSPITDCA